jgi:hypothetical protein
MDQYPLRNIDDDLWLKTKMRVLADGVSIRDVIELGLRLYVARGLEALGGKATAAKKRQTAVAR